MIVLNNDASISHIDGLFMHNFVSVVFRFCSFLSCVIVIDFCGWETPFVQYNLFFSEQFEGLLATFGVVNNVLCLIKFCDLFLYE